MQMCVWKRKPVGFSSSFPRTDVQAYAGPVGCYDGLLPNATDNMCYGCDDGLVLKSRAPMTATVVVPATSTTPARTIVTKIPGYAGCVDPSFVCPSTFPALCYGSWGASNPLTGISEYVAAGAVCTNQYTTTTTTTSTTTKSCPPFGTDGQRCEEKKSFGFGTQLTKKCLPVGSLIESSTCTYALNTTSTSTYVYTPTSTACPTTTPWPAWGWTYPCPDDPRPPKPPAPPPLAPSPPSFTPPRPPGTAAVPPPPAPPVPTGASQTCTDSLGGVCSLVWDALTTAGSGFLKLSSKSLGTPGARGGTPTQQPGRQEHYAITSTRGMIITPPVLQTSCRASPFPGSWPLA